MSHLKLKIWRLVPILALMGNGCTLEQKPYLMEIVGLNPVLPRHYSLRVVKVDKSPTMQALDQQEFMYLSDVTIYQKNLAEAALKSLSFDEMRRGLQRELGGKTLEPIYSINEGVFRAGTFESLLTLSAFYHFNSIRSFAKSHGLLNAEHDRNPLRIFIYGEIFPTNGDLHPVVSHDNAVYVGSVDAIMLFPLKQSQGLPMSMNEGVLAHEYHHRLFFNQLWVNKSSPKRWLRYQSRYNPQKKLSLNRSHLLLASTDEALADIFAVAYTGLPNFMAASLTSKKAQLISEQRELEGDFAEKVNYDALASSRLHPKFRRYCPAKSRNFTNANFNIYCLATVIAKVFYEACEKDPIKLATIAIPIVHDILPIIGKALEEQKPYNLSLFFDTIADASKDRAPLFHAKLCHQLNLRFKSLIIRNGISSCSIE